VTGYSTPDARPITLFSKCRNELLRLPAFLKHYRSLGVDRFFIVDNDSSDGTPDYLVRQPDVRVFHTAGSFREARGGTAWLNALLSQFGVGCWCLTVDIDELLYYPGSETTPLGALTSYLENGGYEALPCILLDMYPGGPLKHCMYAPGDDLVRVAPYFDPGPYARWPARLCPGYLAFGGVRERIFYPEVRSKSIMRKLRSMLYDRITRYAPVAGRLPWVQSLRAAQSPCLTKIPLVKWDANTTYLDVNHFVSRKKLAPESGVLLHFKFLQDFHDRAVQEATRGQYFDGASEYRRYAERLGADPEMTLMYEASVRFSDSRQLVEMKLMTDTPAWAGARRADAGTGSNTSG
jgi:hypothetical protein